MGHLDDHYGHCMVGLHQSLHLAAGVGAASTR